MKKYNEWIAQAASFPRPDRMRKDFLLLDGEWDFAFDYLNRGQLSGWPKKHEFGEKINVPFCVESELSGVKAVAPPNVFWYGRQFNWPDEFAGGRRALLHFGAVDYAARVWLNGKLVGEHTGGYTSFCLDVTEHIRPGENYLTVRVREHLDPRIPRGKQSPVGMPFGIIYTPVSGIWQSVWLESVGKANVADITVLPHFETGQVEFTVEVVGKPGKYKLGIEATNPKGVVTELSTDFELVTRGDTTIVETMIVKNPQAWAPGEPNLYRLTATISSRDGEVQDALGTHFGFRTIEVVNNEILFNGRKLYQKLLLNQGYFPGGHYTPADWDLFRADAQQALDMGFNGVRMHQKIENPKFLFWCDALGLLVWEEMPSAWLWSGSMRDALRRQWTEAVIRDRNHPCIITWVPFNESWGVNNLVVSSKPREFIKDIVALTHKLDATRPVIDNSGFEHVVPEILDLHHYLGTVEQCREYYARLRDPKKMAFHASNIVARLQVSSNAVSPLAPGAKYEGQPLIISEYGGFGFYKTKGDKPLIDNFREYTLAIAEDDLFWGYCYTQQYDTLQEQNGLLTFDREPKVPIEEIQAVNRRTDDLVEARWDDSGL